MLEHKIGIHAYEFLVNAIQMLVVKVVGTICMCVYVDVDVVFGYI